MISPALAHGSSGAETAAAYGPLILIAIGVVVVLVLVGEKKWRGRKRRRAELNR